MKKVRIFLPQLADKFEDLQISKESTACNPFIIEESNLVVIYER